MADVTNSKPLRRLVDDLRGAHGENLASVTLYGSTARDELTDARADHNVLVVLRRVALDDLQLSIEPVRTWTNAGQPMPVYFSLDELQRAADVFPVEFLQMQTARKVLYGADPFEFIEISNANLRHQTEYELRTKFQQLRRLYFRAAGSPQRLSALMADSISSFVALFRAVLVLKGRDSPISKQETLRTMATLFPIDALHFERILELRVNSSLDTAEITALFSAYLAQLANVIEAVDRLNDIA